MALTARLRDHLVCSLNMKSDGYLRKNGHLGHPTPHIRWSIRVTVQRKRCAPNGHPEPATVTRPQMRVTVPGDRWVRDQLGRGDR